LKGMYLFSLSWFLIFFLSFSWTTRLLFCFILFEIEIEIVVHIHLPHSLSISIFFFSSNHIHRNGKCLVSPSRNQRICILCFRKVSYSSIFIEQIFQVSIWMKIIDFVKHNIEWKQTKKQFQTKKVLPLSDCWFSFKMSDIELFQQLQQMSTI
jgi:hypothetical protein